MGCTDIGLEPADGIFDRKDIVLDVADMNLEPPDNDLETLWQFYGFEGLFNA